MNTLDYTEFSPVEILMKKNSAYQEFYVVLFYSCLDVKVVQVNKVSNKNENSHFELLLCCFSDSGEAYPSGLMGGHIPPRGKTVYKS